MKNNFLWHKITVNLVANALNRYGYCLKWRNTRANVLDIGCGEGTVTANILYPYIKKHTGTLRAIDRSRTLINYAKEKHAIPNIVYQAMDVMNIEHVEKMNAQFSHIFSFYAAQWMTDQRSFVDGLYKMLKADGQIFVTHFSRSPMHDSYERHFKEGTWAKYLPQERAMLYYTDDPAQYIRKIVEEIGFKIEVCEHEKITLHIENYPDFTRAVALLYPYLDRIPLELQEEYIQGHIKYCTENSTYLETLNVHECPYEILTCIASKES